MTINPFEMFEDDPELMKEASWLIKTIFEGAQHIIDNPDAYTKEEVVDALRTIVTFFGEAWTAGETMIQGQIEINEMTKDPTKE